MSRSKFNVSIDESPKRNGDFGPVSLPEAGTMFSPMGLKSRARFISRWAFGPDTKIDFCGPQLIPHPLFIFFNGQYL